MTTSHYFQSCVIDWLIDPFYFKFSKNKKQVINIYNVHMKINLNMWNKVITFQYKLLENEIGCISKSLCGLTSWYTHYKEWKPLYKFEVVILIFILILLFLLYRSTGCPGNETVSKVKSSYLRIVWCKSKPPTTSWSKFEFEFEFIGFTFHMQI